MQKLYIIRGVPGSGKTTRAQELAGMNYFEADQWMWNSAGEYQFDPSRLGYCHTMCKNSVRAALAAGLPVVAVSNTFVKKRDYMPYVKLAEEFGAEVEIIVMTGNWKNVHGVPEETVERMRRQFES
jgi:predicted kinase